MKEVVKVLEYDIIVLGVGPAGASACLYAGRGNMKVLALHYGTSELEKTYKIENYYGFPEGIEGKKLYENGINQAKKIGVEVLEKEIIDIDVTENSNFIVKSTDEIFGAKAIIIASRK